MTVQTKFKYLILGKNYEIFGTNNETIKDVACQENIVYDLTTGVRIDYFPLKGEPDTIQKYPA